MGFGGRGALDAVEREGVLLCGEHEDEIGCVAEEFFGEEDEGAEVVVGAVEDGGERG